MEAQPARTGLLALRTLMQLETLSASLLPGAALLLVSTIGTRWLLPAFIGPFVAVFLCGVVATFFGEFLLISRMQYAVREQLSDLTEVCQVYLAGDKKRRANIGEDGALTTTLARSLNSLLDAIEKQDKEHASPKSASRGISEESFQKQLKQLVHEIAPVMNADLRVKAEATTGDIGALADICNYVIQKLAHQIKVTRSATDLITSTTRGVINRSIEFAQASETHLANLSQTIEKVENLSASVQRLSNRLALRADSVQETQQLSSSEEHKPLTEEFIAENETLSIDNQDNHLEEDFPQQGKLLEETLHTIQEHTVITTSMIGQLYSLAQGLHQSSTNVLNTVEQIGPLVTLAKQWRNSIAAFHILDDDDHQNALPRNEMETSGHYQTPSFHLNEL